MAGARTKTQPVGSSDWIQSEREQAGQYVDQEVEEFSFSVRNELEWLNEHMGELFNKNQVNFADVFKTPGKLRGKTPRTARKQNALGTRQPLTDIFAPNVPGLQSAQKTPFLDKVAQFQIAEDVEDQPLSQRPTSRGKSPQRIGKPGNTDSGYHGMTEDEMDADNKTETATTSSQQSAVQIVPLREAQPPPQRIRDGTAEVGASSDESFMSAKEDLTGHSVSKEQVRGEQDSDKMSVADDEMDVDQEVQETPAVVSAVQESDAEREPMDLDQDLDEETARSPSDASSPEKPLQRKSSFTFTALPAREPLTAKRSIGLRDSHIDAQNVRNSTLARSLGGRSVGVAQHEDEEYAQDQSEESKAHSKSSTQLLHERINLLGKTKELQTSKSVPQAAYPQLPVDEPSKATADDDASDDDWIAPSKPAQQPMDKAHQQGKPASPARPAMHQKSISTTQIPSPAKPEAMNDPKHQKAVSVSNPNFAYATGELQSTTPAGSPAAKKHHDGPLSASKSKLYSVLKSAKNIFASSGSVSAAAKLEAHNNSPSRQPKRDISDESKTAAVFNMPGALYSEKQLPQSPSRANSVISASPSRKTRSSNESEKKRQKDLKAQQKAEDELNKAREKERVKAAKQKQKDDEAEAAKKEKELRKQQAAAPAERPVSAGSDRAGENDMPPPPPPKTMLPGKMRARVVKPPRTEQAQSSKPPPVIHIASMSHPRGLGRVPSSSTMSKSQHDNSAPPPPPKPAATRPGSAQGSVRGSTQPTNTRLKALEAAARKKEAEDKAAQKKLEQKRELERKRAEKAEQDLKIEEERKLAEQRRLQELKQAAQRKTEQQAVEAKRREQQRIEQQRQEEEAQRARAHELADAIKRERAQQPPSHPRGDVGGPGTLRQVPKSIAPDQPAGRQLNPARPPKRVWQPEVDEPSYSQTQSTQRPGAQRAPPSYEQKDAKRRRTNEEDQHPDERHSVMAPPKRPSNMRKESTMNKIPHGYAHAPPPANHHPPSMFKSIVTAQHQQQHIPKPGMPTHPSQMVQVSNARIPFAENANPPATAQHHGQGHVYPGHENVQPGAPQSKFKTPGRPAQAPKSAKSSPLYPNGDNIQLPEIQTDSEDEDSEDEDNTGFRAPSWVASPALRELLTQQQLVDPETVFGPIGELKMDEVFRNGKNQERLKRFRDRGSSAAWVESGDAVTSAEKRRDMELRERVVREGGWRFEPNV